MPTVTGETRQEFIDKELAKRSGKSEDKVIHTMPTKAKDSVDIGDSLYVHRHGMDSNGNHSVWVSKGSGNPKKIQTNQNLPTVHQTRPELTQAGVDEIKDYASKYFK